MLKSISKLGTVLSKEDQRKITGGSWPTNQRDCELCGGGWFPPFCLLSVNSPCAA